MSPRFFNCGKGIGSEEGKVKEMASMSPQFFNCGKQLADVAVKVKDVMLQ